MQRARDGAKGERRVGVRAGKEEAVRGPFFGRIYRSPIVREFERLNHRNFISVRPRDITVRSAVAGFYLGTGSPLPPPPLSSRISLPFLGREPSGIREKTASLIGQEDSSVGINGAFGEERKKR